jgi:hypothetical protein
MRLHELQARFMDALLGVDSPHSLQWLGAAEPARFEAYRRNVRAHFLGALHSTYPAVRRLVGEDYFRQIARRFQDRRPSRSGDLSHAGEFFPAYLEDLHAADEFSYLADVARFEWLIQESLLAAEHAPLCLGKLAGIAVERYERLHFDLHPTLRLFESRYPVLRIWEANVKSDAEPEAIDLGDGADCLAIARLQLQLKFHRLSRGEARLLRALESGAAIGDAVEAAGAAGAGAACEEFDATAALQRCVAAGVIVDFH